jgi:hypothetical protein
LANRLHQFWVEVVSLSQSDDWFSGASLICAAGGFQVATTQFENWKLATVSPSLLTPALPVSSLSLPSYDAPSEPVAVPGEPKAEWAAEAIVNLRHVVAGVSFAFAIEGAVALCIFATWNLWHIR